MPALVDADTIRILVATDNHVGCHERDPIRGDDSWKSFHEVLCLAREHDVDLVLLAGDLFHENTPSRKALYQVMRSLRLNCLGDRPCELEMLSDASEAFPGAFNHVNYEDHDLNVAIPVFSIHGNHDDPAGDGHLAALDVLQVSGLLNYYGRTPESDRLLVKPVLLQKGRTKLALYGIGNVRDERLFRTFRDGHVHFFRPSIQQEDWFNLICVHQNRHAHSTTNYLPEAFLPEFLDMVIWGHEHECITEPQLNPETNFHVLQPGSSIATSLVAGEATPKHVTLLHITGREFHTEPLRLKTVRPMVVRDVILADDKVAQRLARKENQRTEVTRLLMDMVEELIEEAAAQWREVDPADGDPMPLPLVRLRVEVTTPDGGRFDCENPQRFSNRFVGKVANVNDVVQFHQKRKSAATSRRADGLSDEAEAAISHLTALDTVRVEQLVREFLAAQSLTILPQNSFGDAVSQFVDKDDKHAMEMFVNESLENQVQHLLALDQDAAMEDEDEGQESLQNAMEKYRSQMEERFSQGIGRRTRGGKKRFKPKPDGWDTEFDGVWEDQPGALIHSDREDAEAGEDDEQPEPPRAGRGRGRGRGGGRAATTASTRKAATTTAKKSVVTKASRARRRLSDDDDDEDPEDMVNDDDDDETVQGHLEDLAISDEDALFVPSRSSKKPTTTRTRPAASSAARAATTSSRRGTTRVAASGRSSQTTLKFAASGSSQPASAGDGRRTRKGDTAVGTGTRSTRTARGNVRNQVSDDDDDDDDDDGDDAFEPAPARRR